MFLFQRTKTTVYKLWYELLWKTKNEKRFFNEDNHHEVRGYILDICNKNSFRTQYVKMGPNYVLIRISIPPNVSIGEAVKKLKGISASLYLQRHPEHKKVTGESKLWKTGYVIGTADPIEDHEISSYLKNNDFGYL